MRTTQRDQGGTITFAGTAVDGPTASGVAQPGSIPFTVVRNATGSYTVRFDRRLMTLAVNANCTNNYLLAAGGSVGAGGFAMTLLDVNGAVGNANFGFTCTVLDRRT
jgi:hypothetical protein